MLNKKIISTHIKKDKITYLKLVQLLLSYNKKKKNKKQKTKKNKKIN